MMELRLFYILRANYRFFTSWASKYFFLWVFSLEQNVCWSIQNFAMHLVSASKPHNILPSKICRTLTLHRHHQYDRKQTMGNEFPRQQVLIKTNRFRVLIISLCVSNELLHVIQTEVDKRGIHEDVVVGVRNHSIGPRAFQKLIRQYRALVGDEIN